MLTLIKFINSRICLKMTSTSVLCLLYTAQSKDTLEINSLFTLYRLENTFFTYSLHVVSVSHCELCSLQKERENFGEGFDIHGYRLSCRNSNLGLKRGMLFSNGGPHSMYILSLILSYLYNIFSK